MSLTTRTTLRRSLICAGVLILGVAAPITISTAAETAPVPAPAIPAATSADEQARDLFIAGRYPEALATYERLRHETRHPTYLRNIGRCHQMMQQPRQAIDAFEGYLREAPQLDAAERAEVERYIAEQRSVEARSSPVASPTLAPATAAGPPAVPGLTEAPTAAPAPAAGTVVTSATVDPVGAPPEGDHPSLVQRWWFWAGIAVVAAAVTITAVSLSGGSERLSCPQGAVCP